MPSALGRPAMLAIFVTSMASRRDRGGRIDGSRRAASDFPAPGGPTTRAACPPAAATSRPRRNPGWPFRSAMSGRAGVGLGPTGASGPSGISPLASNFRSDSEPSGATARSSTSLASAALPTATAIPRPLSRLDLLRHREHPRQRPDRAVEGELSRQPPVLDPVRRELARRDQDRGGDREVKARPGLAQVGRRQVGCDPLLRELEPRVHERGPDALARLAHGGVGQPDEREGRQASVDVDLDVDGYGVDAVESQCSRSGEHQATLGRRRRTRGAIECAGCGPEIVPIRGQPAPMRETSRHSFARSDTKPSSHACAPAGRSSR